MLKGLWIAFRRVVDNARAGDADAADPYVLLCNTPEFSDRNNGDFDCDVPWIRGPGSEDDPGDGPPEARGVGGGGGFHRDSPRPPSAEGMSVGSRQWRCGDDDPATPVSLLGRIIHMI